MIYKNVFQLFFEILIAPSFSSDALEILKSKKNRIILQSKPFEFPKTNRRSILNGELIQERDHHTETEADLKFVTDNEPSEQEIADLIFANGGDRTASNIPEMDIDDSRLEFVFGVGGFNKANSSSWILQEWKAPKTERPWGYYRVLHEVGNHVKLKELTVNPGAKLSMQRHSQRAEFWFVAEGEATVYTVDPYSTDYDLLASPARHQSTWIH